MLKNKKILVFGSGGYLGSKFCELIEKNNIIDKPKFQNYKTNLGDFYYNKINFLIKNNNYSHIVNFHAHTDIKKANQQFKYDFYHNCSIVHSIINSLIKNLSKSFFLNIGTVTQVGYTNFSSKIQMNYSNKPNNIFDLHKQYNEDFLRINKLIYGIGGTTLRLSNIFGQSNKIFSVNRGLINKLIDSAIINNSIDLYGSGKNIRDFLYIDDAINGIMLALKNSEKLNDSFYYLSSGKGTSFNNLAKILKKNTKTILNSDLKINYKKWPVDLDILNKRNFVGNPNSFKKATKWKPMYSLENAIIDYIKNFKLI